MFGAEDCASCRGARTPSMAGRDTGVSLYLVEIVKDGTVMERETIVPGSARCRAQYLQRSGRLCSV